MSKETIRCWHCFEAVDNSCVCSTCKNEVCKSCRNDCHEAPSAPKRPRKAAPKKTTRKSTPRQTAKPAREAKRYDSYQAPASTTSVAVKAVKKQAGSKSKTWTLALIFALAARAIREVGSYCSTDSRYARATKSHVLDALETGDIETSQEDQDVVERTMEWLKTLKEARQTDYVQRLREAANYAAKRGEIDPKALGILVSAVDSATRASQVFKPVGNIGDERCVLGRARIVSTTKKDKGGRRRFYIVRAVMTDGPYEGARIVWFSGFAPDEGREGEVTGVANKHSEEYGETTLGRVYFR